MDFDFTGFISDDLKVKYRKADFRENVVKGCRTVLKGRGYVLNGKSNRAIEPKRGNRISDSVQGIKEGFSEVSGYRRRMTFQVSGLFPFVKGIQMFQVNEIPPVDLNKRRR